MPFNQPNHSREYRPLMGGIAVYNPNNWVEGTLGLIATDGVDRWILSAYHVLARSPGSPSPPVNGESIWQPFDASGAAPHIALLDLPRCDFVRDIAFAKVVAGVPSDPWILGIGRLSPETLPVVGMRVIKSGLATGVTEGVVVFADPQVVRIEPPAGFPAKYDLSSQSDSGSVWVDAATLSPVALHTRGQEGATETAFATPIASALAAAGLTTFV